MSIATQPPGSRPAMTPASAGSVLTQPVRKLPSYVVERVRQLSTPALLRVLLLTTWSCALLLWLTAYLGIGVYRNGLQRIGRDAGTGIIQAQRIKSALTAMDANLVQLLLIPPGGENNSRLTEAQAVYDARRQEFGTALINAAANMKGGQDERDLIIQLQNEAPRYDDLVAWTLFRNEERARTLLITQARSATEEPTPPQSTTSSGSSLPTATTSKPETTSADAVRAASAQSAREEDVANYRAARDRLREPLLSAAESLRKARSSTLEATYTAQTNIQNIVLCLLVFFGMVLIAALIVAQWALFQRTRRLINPGLGLATLLAVGMFFWLGTSFYLAAQSLQTTKEAEFSTITNLEDARSSAYEARSLEEFYLLLTGDKTQKAANAQYDAKIAATETLLSYGPASSDAEEPDTSATPATASDSASPDQQSSDEQALSLFDNYSSAHAALVGDETKGRHEAALESGTASLLVTGVNNGSASKTFAAFDGALSHDLEEQRKNFDATIEGGFQNLENRELFVTLLVLVVAASTFWGISSRLKEYAV